MLNARRFLSAVQRFVWRGGKTEKYKVRSVLNSSHGITIVIPAYNEANRLGPTLDRVLDFVRQQAWDAEVIVVDDGSRDGTADGVCDD